MAEEMLQKSKEKFYRGIELEDLKKLDMREFAKLVKSRQRRYLLRNGPVIDRFIAKCEKRSGRNKPIKTHDRELIIVPKMVGLIIQVHNGHEFVKVPIVAEMLGHRLGEFSLTRKIAKHTTAGVGATKSTKPLAK